MKDMKKVEVRMGDSYYYESLVCLLPWDKVDYFYEFVNGLDNFRTMGKVYDKAIELGAEEIAEKQFNRFSNGFSFTEYV